MYTTFYHKISRESMQMQISQVDDFIYAIWEKLNEGYTMEEPYDTTTQEIYEQRTIQLNISLRSFRMFGFLDDTGFRTTAPRREGRRLHGYHNDIQHSFNYT